MEKKKLRAALLGFGSMGHFHASCYPEQKDVELVAVCDIDPAKFDNKSADINIGNSGKTDLTDVRRYLSYEEMVKDGGFDFIDICLPGYLHAEYAIRAMNEGFDVLCEKPMSRYSKQAEEMIKCAESTGRRLMIAQCLRFDPSYEKFRELLLSNEFGELLRLDMRRNSGMPESEWYHDPAKSGGALLDLHLHDTDFINWIFGMPEAVRTCGICRDNDGIDELMTTYIYSDGPVINAESSWCRSSWYCCANAVFRHATVTLENHIVRVIRFYPESRTEEYDFTREHDAYFNEIAAFAAGNTEKCSMYSTRDSIVIAEAEERSARNKGAEIKLKQGMDI